MGLTFSQEGGECVKGASTSAITISPISLCITHKCKEHINLESKSPWCPWEMLRCWDHLTRRDVEDHMVCVFQSQLASIIILLSIKTAASDRVHEESVSESGLPTLVPEEIGTEFGVFSDMV